MKSLGLKASLLLIVSAGAIMGFKSQQDTGITRAQLREMLTQLGYDVSDLVKDPGKEKYVVKLTKNDLNIPVGLEISPSNSYVWLTVNLGDAPNEGDAKTFNLLKQNGKVQPTFFYITEGGKLMCALAVENRGITNTVLRTRVDTFTDNVGSTKDVWQSK